MINFNIEGHDLTFQKLSQFQQRWRGDLNQVNLPTGGILQKKNAFREERISRSFKPVGWALGNDHNVGGFERDPLIT